MSTIERNGIRPGRRAAGFCAVLALLLAACATGPPRSPEQQHADEALANQVYSALNADPTYFYRHVTVHADRGVVSLSGYVWSTPAIYHARQLASRVPGVTLVHTNQLELERNGRDVGVTR